MDHPHRRRGPAPRVLALEAVLAFGAIALLAFVGWDAGGRAVVRTPALPLVITSLTVDHATTSAATMGVTPADAGSDQQPTGPAGAEAPAAPHPSPSRDAASTSVEVYDEAPGPPVIAPDAGPPDAGPGEDAGRLAGTDESPASELGPAEQDAPRPIGLRLPSISVDIEVIPLGLQDDGTLEVPADAAVSGWWTGGADPGERGPAVIAAHVDSYEGPGAFFRLPELEPGDTASIDREDGTTVTFVVDRIEIYPKEEFPTDEVYGDTDEPTLRLITCGGAFDHAARSYDDNVIVYLDLEGWS